MPILSSTGTHILVFPFPAQGHIIPLLDLTHKLANQGLTITILVTPKNLPLLNPLLSSNPSIKTLVLPFPSHPSIPSGVENLQQLPSIGFFMISALGKLYHPLVNWFKSHPSPPSVIISDMFLGWTHRLATELNIRRIVFSPSGALALSVIYSLWRDMPKHNNEDESDVISFPQIPNCPKYPWWQISPLYRKYVEGEPESEFIKEAFRCNLVSWGLVINSFTELESVYLDYLKKEMGHDRVWAVGPLFHAPSSGAMERGGPSSISVKDVMTWLDECDDQNRKVVYICFGSQTPLTDDQTKEVASSLDNSNVNFIWCVKEQLNQIPSGFDDRVAGRGIIIRGWAPQAFILSHRAVGAFLTHCGWNSVLEALINGVPMLAWPMGADQFADATLLVEELKVAVRVCEGKKVPNSDELGGVLMEWVSGKGAEKERAQKLRKMALDAIKDGGSSKEDLHNLVADLLRN